MALRRRASGNIHSRFSFPRTLENVAALEPGRRAPVRNLARRDFQPSASEREYPLFGEAYPRTLENVGTLESGRATPSVYSQPDDFQPPAAEEPTAPCVSLGVKYRRDRSTDDPPNDERVS